VKNATDVARNSVFESADPLTLSIHCDFKTTKVTPASNAIRADSAGNNHLKSWVVEASQDGKNCQSLDKGVDEPNLNCEGEIAGLSLRTIEWLWFIQLRQTGFNHTDHMLAVGLDKSPEAGEALALLLNPVAGGTYVLRRIRRTNEARCSQLFAF
jgi:hypothetical protein